MDGNIGGASMYFNRAVDSKQYHKQVESVYLKNRDALFQQVYRILRDVALSEDAVHDAIEKMLCAKNRYELSNPVKAKELASKIVRGIAIDKWRSRRKEVNFDAVEQSAHFVTEECGYANLEDRAEYFLGFLCEEEAMLLRKLHVCDS